MAEKDSQSNSQEQQPERKFSQEQYDMLKRCSEKKDMTEWNQWFWEHIEEKILLENADLGGANLKNALLLEANLEKAYLKDANLEYAKLMGAKFYPIPNRL